LLLTPSTIDPAAGWDEYCRDLPDALRCAGPSCASRQISSGEPLAFLPNPGRASRAY